MSSNSHNRVDAIRPDIEIIADGLNFPEGPVYCSDGSILLCEIFGGRITKIDPSGHTHLIAEIEGGPNGLAIGPDKHIYVCDNGGHNVVIRDGKLVSGSGDQQVRTGAILKINPETHQIQRIYDQCGGRPLVAPNDIVFASDGSFWFTDLGKDDGLGGHKYGGLFHAEADGSAIRCVASGVGLNGVGLSPDGSTVYAAATYHRWLIAFDTAPDASNPQSFREIASSDRIIASFEKNTFLDSMAIEADGTIAQACIVGRSGVARMCPRSGLMLSHFDFGDSLTTNIAFGGADMQTAFITLSGQGQLIKTRWPRPGLRLNFGV